MIAFETTVRIGRPVEEVFAFVSDPRRFPAWSSAVRDVRATSPATHQVGSTYTMERLLPGGPATNRLEIVVRDRPREFAVRASAGPTPFLYRYGFSDADGETVVRLNAEVELSGAATVVPQLARRAVKRGVDDNMARLKQLLEHGT
jgi:hypothetical protein